MNDPLDLAERLAVRARQHTVPYVSVADAVITQLRRPEPRPLVWITVWAVAAVILMMALWGVPSMGNDPLDPLFLAADFIRLE